MLKYRIIKDKKTYFRYCDILEELIILEEKKFQDEIELLTVLIEKWDKDNNTLNDSNPIELLKSLMIENNLRAKDLIDILELSKSTVSKILNYHKGLSKDTIRKLSLYFNISQEAFNRPYKLIKSENSKFKISTTATNNKLIEA